MSITRHRFKLGSMQLWYLAILVLLLDRAHSFVPSLRSSTSSSSITNARQWSLRQGARIRRDPGGDDCSSDEYLLAVLGDLHLDRKDMGAHLEGREHLINHLKSLKARMSPCGQSHVVSLGDLGAYGEAGTTASFQLAKEYLEGFELPYSLITGNHDLEGMDEFETDVENLNAWMNAFDLQTPYFAKRVGIKTMIVGLSTTRFRAAQYSSHEVYIDRAQTIWLEKFLQQHREEEGWRVLLFVHAPIMGCGLRVLQNVHVKNGCAWVNHSQSEEERRIFIRLCKTHRCIKAWFSGHFHLSHDYQDSISQAEDTAFIQVGVMGRQNTRDGRCQSRLVKGSDDGLEIYTVNHHKGGELRLDVTIRYKPGGEDIFLAHGHSDYDHDQWFSAFQPQEADGCYLQSSSAGVVLDMSEASDASDVCWWRMNDNRILGVHEGQVIEYDDETLAPLGIVCTKEQMANKELVVVGEGQALMLVSSLDDLDTADPDSLQIIHPNEDGSYWRKRQRNKLIRQREKEREKLAKDWILNYRQSMGG